MPAFRTRQRELAELNASLQDNLSGIREIKAFGREAREAERIGRKIDDYRRSLLRALRLMAAFSPFVEFASSLGTVIVIWFGGRLALGGALPLADLVAFFLYLEMFYGPVRALNGAWEQVQESRAGAERVAELLDERPDIADRPGAAALPDRVEGALEFRDVSFRYSRGEPVLEHVSAGHRAAHGDGARRPLGRGQDHAVVARAPVLRRHRGRGAGRRPGRARRHRSPACAGR